MLWVGFIVVFAILWTALYAALPAVRYLGRRLPRLVARSARIDELVAKHREWLPIAVILVAGALLTVWAGDEFLDLAERVREHAPKLQTIDTGVHDWAVSHRSPSDTLFFVVLSTVGSPPGVAAITAVAAITLAFFRRWRWIAYLAVTNAGAYLLDENLKRFFARARPAMAEALRAAHGYSFPSGHALGSTIGFGALAYLAYRAAKSWPAAAAALAFAVTLIVSVAVSRVYLGVHWISDVAAGITAGLVWLTSATVAYETLRRIRRLRHVREAAAPPLDRPAARTD